MTITLNKHFHLEQKENQKRVSHSCHAINAERVEKYSSRRFFFLAPFSSTYTQPHNICCTPSFFYPLRRMATTVVFIHKVGSSFHLYLHKAATVYECRRSRFNSNNKCVFFSLFILAAQAHNRLLYVNVCFECQFGSCRGCVLV